MKRSVCFTGMKKACDTVKKPSTANEDSFDSGGSLMFPLCGRRVVVPQLRPVKTSNSRKTARFQL